jgi:hypothetical protein
LKLGEILKPESRVWAKPVWSLPTPGARVIAFGREHLARHLERSARPEVDYVLNVGTTGEKTRDPAHRRKLLSITSLVPQVMRTIDIIGPEQYAIWIEKHGRGWDWGLPAKSAWIIRDLPESDGVIPGLQTKFGYGSGEVGVPELSKEEIGRLADLEIVPFEFSVPIFDPKGVAALAESTRTERLAVGRMVALIRSRVMRSGRDQLSISPTRTISETDLHLMLTTVASRQKWRCAVCDGPIDKGGETNRLAQPSPDRIRSDLDSYDEDNIQVTHLACNLAKNNQSDEVIRDFYRQWLGPLAITSKSES